MSALALLAAALFATATPIQVYGVWHAGNEDCVWGTVRNMADFNQKIIGSSTVATAHLTGSLYLTGRKVTAACNSFANSVQAETADYVENVAPQGAGTTPGMLGYMFWAAEFEGTKTQCTTPPNTCEGGLGVGSLL